MNIRLGTPSTYEPLLRMLSIQFQNTYGRQHCFTFYRNEIDGKAFVVHHRNGNLANHRASAAYFCFHIQVAKNPFAIDVDVEHTFRSFLAFYFTQIVGQGFCLSTSQFGPVEVNDVVTVGNIGLETLQTTALSLENRILIGSQMSRLEAGSEPRLDALRNAFPPTYPHPPSL